MKFTPPTGIKHMLVLDLNDSLSGAVERTIAQLVEGAAMMKAAEKAVDDGTLGKHGHFETIKEDFERAVDDTVALHTFSGTEIDIDVPTADDVHLYLAVGKSRCDPLGQRGEFTDDQARAIADEVYAPLREGLRTLILKDK